MKVRRTRGKKMLKQGVAGVMALSFWAGNWFVPMKVQAEENLQKKDYVVLSEDANESLIQEVLDTDEVQEVAVDTDEVYAVKVSTTEEQIEELEKRQGIIVSEDIILNAAGKKHKNQKKDRKETMHSDETEWNMKMINADCEKRKLPVYFK